jgi:hypothetical protein
MSFLSTFKAVSAQLQKVAKSLDDKVDNFTSSVAQEIITQFNIDNEKENEIIEIIKGKLSILLNEPTPKRAGNGFMAFCNAKRKEVTEQEKEKNPDIKPTEISKIIGAMWKNLSDEEKAEYNALAKEGQLNEGKKEQPKKERDVCQFDGCTKVLKNKVEHCGKFYCATHYKKAITDEKKKEVIKCNHVKKDGVKCTANAIDGVWCSKHLKKSPREVPSDREEEKKEVIEIENVVEWEVKDINDGDNDEYWSFRRIKIEGEKCRLHQATNIVLQLKDNVFLGYNKDGEFISKIEEIPQELIEWVKKCGIYVI